MCRFCAHKRVHDPVHFTKLAEALLTRELIGWVLVVVSPLPAEAYFPASGSRLTPLGPLLSCHGSCRKFGTWRCAMFIQQHVRVTRCPPMTSTLLRGHCLRYQVVYAALPTRAYSHNLYLHLPADSARIARTGRRNHTQLQMGRVVGFRHVNAEQSALCLLVWQAERRDGGAHRPHGRAGRAVRGPWHGGRRAHPQRCGCFGSGIGFWSNFRVHDPHRLGRNSAGAYRFAS